MALYKTSLRYVDQLQFEFGARAVNAPVLNALDFAREFVLFFQCFGCVLQKDFVMKMAFYKALNLLLLATLASCEPPVRYNYRGSSTYQNSGYNAPSTPSNTYLPPNNGFSSPSNSYLPPSSFGGQGQYEGHDHGHGHDHGNGHDHEVPKSYEFGYSVKDAQSGNDYGRRESSDGNVVRGEYRVQLPDGRTQIVTYHADWQTGFHADVRYEGEARYPEPTRNQNQGYNYQQPSDFSGSLTGFGARPSTAYGPPGYH